MRTHRRTRSSIAFKAAKAAREGKPREQKRLTAIEEKLRTRRIAPTPIRYGFDGGPTATAE
jgi:hypothetical protein